MPYPLAGAAQIAQHLGQVNAVALSTGQVLDALLLIRSANIETADVCP